MAEFPLKPPHFATPTNDTAADAELPMQKSIERMMKDLIQVGSYDAVYLFDAEGLLLAKHAAHAELVNEAHAVELSVLIGKMQKVIRRLSALGPLREVMIEDQDGRKLVFRYLDMYQQIAILVVAIPPHRTYRSLVNRLCRTIEKLSPH